MSSPTLYLDCLILASAAYPSGFSQSLYALRGRRADGVSTSFLVVLVLPFMAVSLLVWSIRPGLLTIRGFSAPWLLVAVVLAPLCLVIEYAIHAAATYRASGQVPRGITIDSAWQRGLSRTDYLLVGLVVVGEEVIYRMIWMKVLQGSFGIPGTLALGIGSLAYGLNHFAFGWTSVVSKTVTGLFYGSLYLLAGGSLGPPVVAHGLQNFILFRFTDERHA